MADGFGSFPSPACWILYYNSVEKFNTDHIWELGSGWWSSGLPPSTEEEQCLVHIKIQMSENECYLKKVEVLS